jgi:transcriptional regulator with XRE-family HTH domain
LLGLTLLPIVLYTGLGLLRKRGFMSTFGEKLKELRTAAGKTQAGLASESGVPIGTIRDYEQGKRDPLLSTAQKLAHALGHRLDVFNDVTPGIKGKTATSSARSAAGQGKPAPTAKPKRGKRK